MALTQQRATDPGGITFFAFEGETVCGMAACKVEGDEAEMFAVWVAPLYRRSGAGTALIEFAGNWAERQGARRLKAGVYDDNAGALAFYRAAGFDDTGRIKPELSTNNRTVLLLVLNLPQSLVRSKGFSRISQANR
jgi:ribosomal-protein-alanine N-acetyltransferase